MGQPVAMREGRGDRTRAALVRAAIDLFGRKGVEQTSIDEITQAASVAKGTFYVHFQRKQDVLLELGPRSSSRSATEPRLATAPRPWTSSAAASRRS